MTRLELIYAAWNTHSLPCYLTVDVHGRCCQCMLARCREPNGPWREGDEDLIPRATRIARGLDPETGQAKVVH